MQRYGWIINFEHLSKVRLYTNAVLGAGSGVGEGKKTKSQNAYLVTLIIHCAHIILNEFPVNYINHNCYKFRLRNDTEIGKVFNIRKLIIINFAGDTNPYNGSTLEVSNR